MERQLDKSVVAEKLGVICRLLTGELVTDRDREIILMMICDWYKDTKRISN